MVKLLYCMYIKAYNMYMYMYIFTKSILKKIKTSVKKKTNICPKLGLNQRPLAFQANALPLSYSNYIIIKIK